MSNIYLKYHITSETLNHIIYVPIRKKRLKPL